MSTQDDGSASRGHGRNPGSQSGFAGSRNADYASDIQTWGNNALNAQKSEVTLMAHGAGRPGQPAGGQRPMFGGGSPVFAQMPSYTPVTRGPEFSPQPEPPQQPSYNPYATPTQPSQQPASGLGYQSPQTPSSFNSYQNPQPAAPSYQGSHPSAAPSYQPPHPSSAPSYQGNLAPSHQAAEFQGQSYQPGNQPARAPGFSGNDYASAQSYAPSTYNGAQGFSGQSYQNFADASFPEAAPGSDASFPESIFDQNFGDSNFGNQGFAKQPQADASFPEPQSFDRNFADASFPSSQAFDHQEQIQPDAGGYGQHDAKMPQGFDTFNEEPAHDYGMGAHGMDHGQVPPSDPRRQLQAFDAIYDQPPQIALGSTEPRRAAQDFYESERVDADFLDEGQVMPPPNARGKMAIRGRSAFMVGSALLGAIALGGAVAYAYKLSGGGLSSAQPPIVQADNSPVKELPDDPGGKQFPHKNKLIYDRLQNVDDSGSERLVPRLENVAVPAMPSATETAGLPAPVATTDLGTPPTTQAVGGAEPIAVASVGDNAMPDGGPRRVKTMVVKPDGSMAQPAPSAEAAPAAPEQIAAAPQAAAPAPQAADTQAVASLQAPPPAPAPKAAAKPVQTASATPQAATPPSKYVVQVGSKKNQTDALASFADMQQKYPSLLANYRPMVQKADLGAKGTWYRLRIGPIADKTAATKLCSQLKSQGLPDCLVMAQ
jgi:cell division septation protein DedD